MSITDIYTSDYSKIGMSQSSAQSPLAKEDAVSTENLAAVRSDTVVKSDKQADEIDTGIYSREKIIETLKNAEQVRAEGFRKLIESLISGQAGKANLTIAGLKLNVSFEDSQAALEAISEGGEYSVDAVAGRIMDMAKALAGGDSSKIEELRTAVQKGFTGAASALGIDYEKMPDITKLTYDRVMQSFDEWSESFKDTADIAN